MSPLLPSSHSASGCWPRAHRTRRRDGSGVLLPSLDILRVPSRLSLANLSKVSHSTPQLLSPT